MSTEWQVEINNFLGGFAPGWYKETYPSYGNKNQAGTMLNIDLTNPGYLTAGLLAEGLTNGTQTTAVTTLIKGILDQAVTSNLTYAVGGAKLYSLSNTAVTNGATFPHTIDKGAVTAEDGEDVAYFQGNLYYSYNHSGSVGDIGKYDLNVTFDDDWGSTVPAGGAALQSGPHQFAVGGNDVLYFSNGRYVGSYDGSTFAATALDLPTNSVVQSIVWFADRLWVTAIRPNLSGSNKVNTSIYVWDGTSDSWEAEIKTMGLIGALHVKNGVLFVFYEDVSFTGGFKLGYVNGSSIEPLANFPGALPAFYQVTDYKDFIIWSSNDSIYAWGNGDKDMPVRLFQMANSGFTTAGGLATPFGSVIAASNASTSYLLAKLGTTTYAGANWKSLMFDITGGGIVSKINGVRFNFEKLLTGDLIGEQTISWSLVNNQGVTIYSDTISYSKLGAVTTKYYPLNGKVAENFRVELNFANGQNSASPIKVKSIKIYGTIS